MAYYINDMYMNFIHMKHYTLLEIPKVFFYTVPRNNVQKCCTQLLPYASLRSIWQFI